MSLLLKSFRAHSSALLVISVLALSLTAIHACGGDDFDQVEVGRVSIDFPDSPLASDNVVFFGALTVMGAQDSQRIIVNNNTTTSASLEVTKVTSIVTTTPPNLVEVLVNNAPVPADSSTSIEPDALVQFDVLLFCERATTSDPGCTQIQLSQVPAACQEEFNNNRFDNYRDTACGGVFIETSDPNQACVIGLISITRGGGTLQIDGDLNNNRRITFQTAAAGEPAQTQDITLSNVGSSSLMVNWSLMELQLEAEFEIQPAAGTIPAGGEQTFTLTYTPVSTDPMMSQDRGTLLLTTNDSENPNVPFSVRVGDPDSAVLNVSPTSLDFGGVTMGDNRTESITVNNGGTLNPLTVNLTLAPSTASSDYTVQCRDSAGATAAACPTPLVVPAGEDRFVDVTYTPTMDTPLDARLIVSAQDNMSTEVALNAKGTAGNLGPSPDMLAFMNVTPGQAASLPITLNNSGASDAVLSALNTTGANCDQFAVSLQNQMDMLPVTITPGGTAAVDVIFTRPASDTMGTAATCDIIFVNDGGTPMLTVTATYTP